MAYHIYTTKGFVLKGLPSGEADKYYYMLTEELGLVVANARSVRKSESKLSAGLEDFSFGTFSFIRGKHSWKIISSQPEINTYRSLGKHPQKRLALSRFLALTRRLVTGESVHKELFSLTHAFSQALLKAEGDQKELLAIESLAILRLLFELGYMNPRPEYEAMTRNQNFDVENITAVLSLQKQILADINSSLAASQL
jgi:DNA repair protein RecO (recombination protein O)